MGTRTTAKNFIEKAQAIHGDRYDYSETIYVSAHEKIRIGCSEHGQFEQAAYSHLNGRGCPRCANQLQAKKKSSSLETFLKNAREVHGDRYSYEGAIYTGRGNHLWVTCPTHGDFLVTPHNHVSRKSGCPQCAILSRAQKNTGRRRPGIGGRPAWTREQFIVAAREVHGDKYSYENLVYENVNVHVTLTCPTHGDFNQFGSAHLAGQGCPSCPTVISNGHSEISDFLTNLGVDHHNNDRKLIKPLELDIVIPDKNLAVEYCGLYWHSEMKKTMMAHQDKHKICEGSGIRLITIFEDEWKNRPEVVKATLRHFCGKSERGINARSAMIKEIDWITAKPFLAQHHLLGSGQSGTYQIGAFSPTGELIGVMTYGVPSDERGRTDLIEMKRFVTDGRNHPGLGSRMFKWATRTYGWTKVMAFVDRRWFTGSFKGISGFKVMEETAPTLYWTDFKRRYKRRFITKAQLIEMEQFRGTNQTKVAMMNQLGYYRIWDCGKLRLEWVA